MTTPTRIEPPARDGGFWFVVHADAHGEQWEAVGDELAAQELKRRFDRWSDPARTKGQGAK